MKKTLSLALVAVLWLWVTASTFAFFPGGEWTEEWWKGRWMKMGGSMMMFGWEQGPRWKDNQKGWKGHGGKDALFGTAVQAAITNKDYDAFVKAWNEDQSKVTAPTTEEFAQRVTITKARQAIDDAISAGNYEAFKTALTNLPKPANASGSTAQTPNIPTQDEFNKMVAQKKAREAMKTAIESNDYNAFLAAWNANKPSVPTKDEFIKMTERVNKVVNNVSKKLQNGVKKVKRVLNSTGAQS